MKNDGCCVGNGGNPCWKDHLTAVGSRIGSRTRRIVQCSRCGLVKGQYHWARQAKDLVDQGFTVTVVADPVSISHTAYTDPNTGRNYQVVPERMTPPLDDPVFEGWEEFRKGTVIEPIKATKTSEEEMSEEMLASAMATA